MIVGESESKSLLNDISKLPVVIYHFVAFIPNEISAMFRRGAHLGGVLAILGFGLFAQITIWALLNKPFWTYKGGQEVFLLKYWGTNGIILMILAVLLSSIVYDRRHKH